MKKVLLFFLILITLIINKGMIFAVEEGQAISEEEKIEIKEDVNILLNKRSNLWNKLLSQQGKREEISQELKEVVAEPLLTYDLEAFSEITKEHTGMERILKVDVLDISNIKVNEEEIVIDIEVEWLMEGFEKNYKEKLDYRMNLIKKDSKWKISDYNVI